MNHLGNASSPYLLLHKDNPVEWYSWGQEAFDAARASGKPILLSLGYTACHWCHVMNNESFSDGATAALLNDGFINIIVDREERPDIDQIYQAAANTMGNNGGWPLNVFLTHEGAPYFVTGYLPPEERSGMPAFQTVLRDMAQRYREQHDMVIQNSSQVVSSLNQLWNRDMRGNIDPAFIETASIRFGQRYDVFFGGMQGPTKFANVSTLEVLWRAYLRSGFPQFLQLAATTVDNICLGGLYDHVGGGVFRYCTDERWLIPHFEKILSDNAQLVDFLTTVWQFNRNNLSRDTVRDTIGWMLREMKVGEGFAATLTADSEGEEGKYYLWTEAEIDAALMGTFVQRFKTVYNVRREGNINGRSILHRIGSPVPYPLPEADDALVAKQRQLLLAARQTRTPPVRDDKVLADWNGYVITALTNAGAAFKNNDWISQAIRTFDFIVKALGDGDRLYHSWRDGKRSSLGFADDYASMARAALALWEVTSEKRFLDYAKRWTNTLNEHYWDNDRGGYAFTSDDAEPLVVRARMVFDQPAPSANGLMMGVLGRLHLATGDQAYFDRGQSIAVVFGGEATRAWQSMGAYFNNMEFLSLAAQIVIIGPQDNAKTHELAQAVYGRSFPNRLVTMLGPNDALPEGHPAHGKTMQNGQPTAYICQRNTCSPPITNAVQLSQILQLPQQRQQQQQQMAQA
jgi:uncharacterized protein YyaL (SSP411 family)